MRIRLNVGDTGLKAVLAGAKTTLDPSVVVQYYDDFGEYAVPVDLNGVTAVVLLAAPTAGRRVVTGLSLYNRDTGAITVTFTSVLGGSSTVSYLLKVTLGVGETLVCGDQFGVSITDVNGQRKTANAATVPVTLTGAVNEAVGASTVAAGTTYADAGALPAGTAGVYPTTGATDATGVIINVADQVTGRKLFIGNGVSNKILKVYGPAGAVINGASANTAFSSASGKGVSIVCLSGAENTWLAN